MSGVAHFFMSVGGSKFHERLAHFFIDIYTAQIFVSGVAHFFMSVGGSKFHERLAHFFIDIYTLDTDIAAAEQEQHLGWIQTLALAGCRTGGKCALTSVKQAVSDLRTGKFPEELLGALYKYYDYYFRLTRQFWGDLWGIMPFWTMDSGKKLMD